MEDAGNNSATRQGAGRWTKVLLAVSLAVNLLIGGLAVGAMLGPDHNRGGRDFGLGPLSEALSREDRKALRGAFLERHPDAREDRRAARAEFDALLAALRAEPFDADVLDAALQAVAARNTALLETGRELVAGRVKAMDPAERAAFADRLEKGLRRMGGKEKHKD